MPSTGVTLAGTPRSWDVRSHRWEAGVLTISCHFSSPVSGAPCASAPLVIPPPRKHDGLHAQRLSQGHRRNERDLDQGPKDPCLQNRRVALRLEVNSFAFGGEQFLRRQHPPMGSARPCRPARFSGACDLGTVKSRLQGAGGGGWAEKPQVKPVETLTDRLAPGVFAFPKAAEGIVSEASHPRGNQGVAIGVAGLGSDATSHPSLDIQSRS